MAGTVVLLLGVALMGAGCFSSHHGAVPPPGGASAPTSQGATAPTRPSSPSSGASTFAPPAATSGRPYWLLEEFSVEPLLRAGLSSALLQAYFNNPRTFLIVKLGSATTDPLLPDATYVMSFASYRQLQGAFASGSIPSNIKYILYDNERWAATPASEQARPITYAADAEQLAHSHRLGLIFTPAANLSMVLSASYTNTTKYTGYLNLSIAAQGARVSDVFEIQAQQDEGLTDFNSFVSGAVGQARAANPNALILAGLTSKAPAQTVTPQLLLDDYRSTRSEVSGFWLNIPGGTPKGPQNPQVAVAFLEALAPQLGYSG